MNKMLLLQMTFATFLQMFTCFSAFPDAVHHCFLVAPVMFFGTGEGSINIYNIQKPDRCVYKQSLQLISFFKTI